GALWALAQGLAEKGPVKPPSPEWFRPSFDDGSLKVAGENILDAFISHALGNRKEVAAADDLSGVLSYEKLLVGVIALARRLANLPGDNIGLLLPASVASDLSYFALLMAGKLPIMMNWTTGQANLAHAARVMGVSHVVSSKAFIDRVGVKSDGWEYVYLED